MATIQAFSNTDKTAHNSHKFAFSLSPTNYGYWKAMIEPFLITNNLFAYIDETIPCPVQKITTENTTTENPSYSRWISNDAHIRMLIISTISEASFQHVQGKTSRDLWLSLERAYAPNNASREYMLKAKLLKIEMKGDETPIAYLSRAQEYSTALANIGEPMKDKDLVMLAISGLREEYNGLKSNLLARHPPVAFNELHGLLCDHDFLINKSQPSPTVLTQPQAFLASTGDRTNLPQQLAQLQSLHQLASQLGFQLNLASQPQAFYASRPANNRNNRRGNYRGSSKGNYNNYNNRNQSRDNSNQNRNQFAWASTQNTVYGHCNRYGIGHIPSQCPNQNTGNSNRPANPHSQPTMPPFPRLPQLLVLAGSRTPVQTIMLPRT